MPVAPLYKNRPDGFAIRPASQPAATRIEGSIYLSEGLSNAWLVATSAGRVVINTGMGFEAPVHKRNFDAVSRAPLRFILLTQGHVDHVGGVDVLREPETVIVAQESIVRQQADDSRLRAFRAARSGFAFAETVARGMEASAREFGRPPPQAVAVPTITFRDRYSFALGDHDFELLSTPGGETTDSMVAWLPRQGACFVGNLFGALFGHFPNLVTIRGDRYRDALAFVASLERVLALSPELLLVGHHEPVRGRSLIRRELERLRDAVLHVHDATVEGMNAGKDVYALMREVRLPGHLEVGEGYGKVAWAVRAIYETYAGWFHHRSTTELYPVPRDRVDADLIACAGGPERVVVRAEERLAAGDVLEALHLAEVVLGASPRHGPALALSLKAHERLEQESRNFWLSAWLCRRISELRRAIEEEPGEIRITDLAEPVLDARQRAAVAAAESVKVDFSESSILAEACARTGLTNFGDSGFRERLAVLRQEWGSDPGLTQLGRAGLRASLVRYAANRLLLHEALARDPSVRDRRIRAPIVIAGMPRTGTTHLLNLLAADPRLRSLPLWESYEPVPLPGEAATGDRSNPRFHRAEQAWEAMRTLTPLLEVMHPMTPEHVHEELELMTPDFASYNFEWLSMSPRWRDYYLSHDQTPHYRYMADVLRLLQRPDGPQRWVLKCPQHLEQLPALDRVFPDAIVVFTHRDPVAVLQSILTMLAYGQRLNRKRVELGELAAYWSDRVERILRACVRDRDSIPAARSIDVRFGSFVRDEIGTVEGVYSLAGMDFTVDTRLLFERFLAHQRRTRRGRIRYEIEEDFGLSIDALRERFSFYSDRFGVTAEF